MDTQQTLAWLHEVSEQAMTEARSGNVTLANALGKTSAFRYYFDNVHARPALTPEQYARQFPAYIQEAAALKEQYESVAMTHDNSERLDALESRITKELKALKKQLGEAVKLLTEAQAAPVVAEPMTEDETVTDEPEAVEPEVVTGETPIEDEPEAEETPEA